jgi:cardiolipin synthase A/B
MSPGSVELRLDRAAEAVPDHGGPQHPWWTTEQRAARRAQRDERRRRRRNRWTAGNEVRLLENGEEFFPAVFEAIDAAREEVLIETFILFEDKVGHALRESMVSAARRGVRVTLLVDGFGTSDLGAAYIGELAGAGVHLCVFDPCRRVLGMRFKILRRMHRKLVVIDRTLAFIGGINYSADHLSDFGPEAKQDYSASVRGPIVAEIHEFMLRQLRDQPCANQGEPTRTPAPGDGQRVAARPVPAPAGEAQTIFVTRDNHLHRNEIERHYRAAIRSARHRVVIANAYFFPGYLLLRELRRAARRGVDVRLILQGEPDMKIVRAASLLYEYLQRDGVRIFEYCKRPLHGKVALVDDQWATVGSSNLDPLSLSLNLEANLIVRDGDFNRDLAGRLEQLMSESCREAPVTPGRRWPLLHQAWTTFLFHVLRGFPVWAGWLPRHTPKLETLAAPPGRNG